MAKRPQNLKRGITLIGGNIVNELNELKPGLGNKLVGEINQKLQIISNRLEANAGHRGTVGIAKQTSKDSDGKLQPGIRLQGDRVTGVADPVDGTDAITLDYFRSRLNCALIEKLVDECVELPEGITLSDIPDCWQNQ